MNDNEIHLKNYLRIIVKRKYTVGAFFIVVFVIALLGSLNYTPVYTAFSKVLIEKNDNNPLIMNYRYGAAYDPEFLATQAQIIKSEPVSIKVVNTLDLEHQYDSFFRNVKKTGPVNINPVVWFKNLYATLLKIARIGKVMAENQGEEASPNADPGVTLSAAIQNYIRMISRGIRIEPVEDSDVVTISYTSTSPEFSKRVVVCRARHVFLRVSRALWVYGA